MGIYACFSLGLPRHIRCLHRLGLAQVQVGQRKTPLEARQVAVAAGLANQVGVSRSLPKLSLALLLLQRMEELAGTVELDLVLLVVVPTLGGVEVVGQVEVVEQYFWAIHLLVGASQQPQLVEPRALVVLVG
jgi:hypothetical protein